MEGLALATGTPTNKPSDLRFFCVPLSAPATTRRRIRNVCFRRNPRNFAVFATNEGPNLDRWDQMELKFGQLIGEDPKLTLAKIMGRKSDPDVSYLEVEKSFYKRKGKSIEIEEVPFDGSDEGKQSDTLSGLNLVRPVPKQGVKFGSGNKPKASSVNISSQPVKKPANNRGSLPNVILRKPTTFNEEDASGPKESSKFSIKPNLLLRMRNEQAKEKFTDMTLLKKPEPMSRDLNLNKEVEQSGIVDYSQRTSKTTVATDELTLLAQPKQMDLNLKINDKQESSDDDKGSSSSYDSEVNVKGVNLSAGSTERSNFADSEETETASLAGDSGSNDHFVSGLQQSDIGSAEKRSAALHGKPKRLDQSVKGTAKPSREHLANVNPENYDNAIELESFLATSPIKEYEENDWRRAEDLVKTSGRYEVELISSSTRGFVVSFGSLIGFLPYRNLAARWKFLAFESWLRRKGLDPSKYKQNLGIIGNSGIQNDTSVDLRGGPEIDEKFETEISPDMELEDLLRIYDQEKLKFLTSFVGQKLKVNVTLADRRSRRLIFSLRPKEKEEMVDKKRSLMAKLSVGDVLKGRIKKITYFGIFVEVEGVPALIHQTEVSWDATLDPASYFKVGQIVEAKVHQLDFSVGRIYLSLKEITPDPLIEALEAVIGDNNSLDGRLEAAQEDSEWADVESLIRELLQFEGIQSVTKGRLFLSPGLAPTFQVYMASMFENEYKLLARSGNKVQEVIVQTSLDKEEMKSAILTCTSRVE